MEWYWIVTLIVGFAGLVGVLVYLGKKGVLNSELLNVIKVVSSALAGASSTIASVVPNGATNVFNQVVGLVNSAVLAAENAWYRGDITKEERNAKCKAIFEQLLKANNIGLSDEIKAVLDSLIAAACEAMGHTQFPVETEE